jgi:hypothetical protein
MIPDDPRELRFKYPEELQAEAQAPPPDRYPSRRWWPWASAAPYCSNLKNASRVRNV